MAPSPAQAEALIAARKAYLGVIRSVYGDRMAIKKTMIGGEPSEV